MSYYVQKKRRWKRWRKTAAENSNFADFMNIYDEKNILIKKIISEMKIYDEEFFKNSTRASKDFVQEKRKEKLRMHENFVLWWNKKSFSNKTFILSPQPRPPISLYQHFDISLQHFTVYSWPSTKHISLLLSISSNNIPISSYRLKKMIKTEKNQTKNLLSIMNNQQFEKWSFKVIIKKTKI